MASSGAIDLDEGVPLGYALVARVAADAGIRTLAIKGPTLAAYGLRDRDQQSIDVDVLVEPRCFGELTSALLAYGWVAPPIAAPNGHILRPHSKTLSHQAWPVQIDVHLFFPGFLAEPELVFDVLWSDRERMEIAGAQVYAPSRAGSAAIALLHLLRGGSRRAEELAELVHRIRAAFDAQDHEEFAALARATGAGTALAEVDLDLGLDVTTHSLHLDEADMWELNRRASDGRTLGWLLTFQRTTPRRWPLLLWRAIWLTEAELRVRYPAAPPGVRGLVAMWIDRWRAGLVAMPQAVRLMRDQRHRRRS